jgi:hypothetical protein
MSRRQVQGCAVRYKSGLFPFGGPPLDSFVHRDPWFLDIVTRRVGIEVPLCKCAPERRPRLASEPFEVGVIPSIFSALHEAVQDRRTLKG